MACAKAPKLEAAEVAEICRAHGAREVRVARDARERDLLWKGRKNAFGAVGRISPIVLHAGWRDSANETSCDAAAHRARLAQNTASKSAIFFMRAMETSIRLFLSTSATQNNCRTQSQPRTKLLACASNWAARSPESTAWEWRKDRLMPLLFTETELDFMRRVRDVFNPIRPAQPGKDFSAERLRRNPCAADGSNGRHLRMSVSARIIPAQSVRHCRGCELFSAILNAWRLMRLMGRIQLPSYAPVRAKKLRRS